MATGTTAFISNVTADVFIPEIWAMEAIVAREQRLVFAPHVNHRFAKELLTKGDKVNIPNVSDLTAQTKSSVTAINYETVTETNQTITVATHQYSAIAVEDITAVQADRNMLETYAGKMGYALDQAVDNVLAGLVDNFSQVVGTLAADLTYDDMLRARQYLDDADAPEENRNIFVSPAQEAGIMKIDNFINSDYTGSNGVTAGRGDKGWVGSWLGMPIWKSTNVEGTNAAGHDNAMFQQDAIGLIMQFKPKMESMRDIDFLVDKVAAQQLHGSKELRDDHGVWAKGS